MGDVGAASPELFRNSSAEIEIEDPRRAPVGPRPPQGDAAVRPQHQLQRRGVSAQERDVQIRHLETCSTWLWLGRQDRQRPHAPVATCARSRQVRRATATPSAASPQVAPCPSCEAGGQVRFANPCGDSAARGAKQGAKKMRDHDSRAGVDFRPTACGISSEGNAGSGVAPLAILVYLVACRPRQAAREGIHIHSDVAVNYRSRPFLGDKIEVGHRGWPKPWDSAGSQPGRRWLSSGKGGAALGNPVARAQSPDHDQGGNSHQGAA